MLPSVVASKNKTGQRIVPLARSFFISANPSLLPIQTNQQWNESVVTPANPDDYSADLAFLRRVVFFLVAFFLGAADLLATVLGEAGGAEALGANAAVNIL